MSRWIACVCLVGIVSWYGESSALAQVPSQPNRDTTSVGGTAGVSTSPTSGVPGGTNLNQGTGAQPNLQEFGQGFVGGSQNEGRFIGSQFSGQQQVGGGRNVFGGGGRGGGGGGRFTMPNQSSRNSATKRVRPRHRIAFAFESRSLAKIQTSLDVRFSLLLTKRPEFKNVTIAVGKPGELTLSGNVPSSTVKRIATAMVRMEPGVRRVTNQLSVVDPKAQPKTDGSPSSSQSPAK
jgi:hypothetical protein